MTRLGKTRLKCFKTSSKQMQLADSWTEFVSECAPLDGGISIGLSLLSLQTRLRKGECGSTGVNQLQSSRWSFSALFFIFIFFYTHSKLLR